MCSARAAQTTRSHFLMDHWGLLQPSTVHSEQCVTMTKAVSVVSSVHQDLQVWLARCQLQVWGLLRRLSATSKVRLWLTSFTACIHTVFTQGPGHIYSGHGRTAAEAWTKGQWMQSHHCKNWCKFLFFWKNVALFQGNTFRWFPHLGGLEDVSLFEEMLLVTPQPVLKPPSRPPLALPDCIFFPEEHFAANVSSISWQWPYILDHHAAAKYFVAFLNPGKLRQYTVTQSDPLKLFTVKVIPTSGTFYFPASIMHFSMCAPVLKSIPTLVLLKFPHILLFLDIQSPLFNHKNTGKMPFQLERPADLKQMGKTFLCVHEELSSAKWYIVL